MGKTRSTAKSDHPSAKGNTSRPAAQVAGQTLADVSGGGSIGQIRDILFGSQMRDYDKKISRMEERILKESADLRADFSKRFESLNSHVRQEIETLVERVKSEQEKRTAGIQKLSQEMVKGIAVLEQKIDVLEKQLQETNTELRQQLLEQSHSLSDDINRKHEQTAAELVETAHELRENKIDRGALADLFVEVAMNLNRDLALPSNADDVEAQDA